MSPRPPCDPVTQAWQTLQTALAAICIPDDDNDPCVRAWQLYVKMDSKEIQGQLIVAAAYQWKQAHPLVPIDCPGLIEAIRTRWGTGWFDRATVHTILTASYGPFLELLARGALVEKARLLLPQPDTTTVETVVKKSSLELRCWMNTPVFSDRHTALDYRYETAVLALIRLTRVVFDEEDPVHVALPPECQPLLDQCHRVTGRKWIIPPLTLQFFQNHRFTVTLTSPDAARRLAHALIHPPEIPPITWQFP